MRHVIPFLEPDAAPRLKLIWLTDLHLDAAERPKAERFFNDLLKLAPDAILIGGDISNGVNSLLTIRKLFKKFRKPIYYVLGNHDYYYGSISEIRDLSGRSAEESEGVHYLTKSGVCSLTANTALIGHDGWSDAKAGDFLNSSIMLHDYLLIAELKDLTAKERKEVLGRLGEEAAEHISKHLRQALQTHRRVIVLTHTPPFRESCLYDGNVCDANWAPHFVCQSMGEVLLEEAARYPDKHILVLCGHSHHKADRRPASNLRVLTGHSELGTPSIQGIIEVD